MLESSILFLSTCTEACSSPVQHCTDTWIGSKWMLQYNSTSIKLHVFSTTFTPITWLFYQNWGLNLFRSYIDRTFTLRVVTTMLIISFSVPTYMVSHIIILSLHFCIMYENNVNIKLFVYQSKGRKMFKSNQLRWKHTQQKDTVTSEILKHYVKTNNIPNFFVVDFYYKRVYGFITYVAWTNGASRERMRAPSRILNSK